MRAVQVTTTIFNDTQSGIIYAGKMFLIATAIVMGSFGILQYHSNWLVGLFGIALALFAEVSYLALYDQAFAIPMRADDVCKETLVKFRIDTRLQIGRFPVLELELRSFPPMGVRLGLFYYMERDSS